ncbi:MAG: guanylate kinase [Lachnospiraceae bacterium]|jgi:guanylate kinase|nr:guanylate kinase [Lachnospiraceae bacterium]
MGIIFCIMGKSACGKDTLYKMLKRDFPMLRAVTMYTTRPIREGEQDGEEYRFVSEARYQELTAQKKVIECRTYQTMAGPWRYFTVDDGEIDLARYSYLTLGTLESYEQIREYYGQSMMEPLYIEVDDGLRLERALERERKQHSPDYRELCRRFLADDEDFSEENLERLGINKRYINDKLEVCLASVEKDIRSRMEQI